MGCGLLGSLYEEGQGVNQDFKQAKSYYEKSCNLDNNFGCFALGGIYRDGLGVRQDFTTAKQYYGKACDFDNQYGCDEYRRINERGY